MGAAPLRRTAAARRPPPRAHRVSRGAGSGVRAPPPAARRALERGGRAPAPGLLAGGLTGYRHRGRAGLAPAARGVRGTRGARSPGSLGRPLPRPKGGVFPRGKNGAHERDLQERAGLGRESRLWLPEICPWHRHSADPRSRVPALCQPRAAGTRTHPRRHRLPGAPLPHRGGGGKVGRAAACQYRVRCLSRTQVTWGPSRCIGGVGARSFQPGLDGVTRVIEE